MITTLSFFLAFLIRFFCTAGNCASPISTPRSPLAIIIASEASIISSILSKASALSIFAIIPPLFPASLSNFLANSISFASLAKDTAR